jgi:hypothetical protein
MMSDGGVQNLDGRGERRRVIVSSDIGGTDYDDFQSLVHLLVYGDVLDIEGLISSPYGDGRKEDILRVIDLYERDYPNLKTYSGRYPTAEKLRRVTKQGAIESAGLQGFDSRTEGSDWIIECAKREDDRPLWILLWGGFEDLAQALHDEPGILSKLRVYMVGGPNKKWSATAYDYIEREFGDLWVIEANSTYRGWFVGGNQEGEWGNDEFVQRQLAGRGAMGEFLASGIQFRGRLRSTLKMGDTPSVAYVLGETAEDPTKESWGGQFVRAWDRPRHRFKRAPMQTDRVEIFSVVEIVYRVAHRKAAGDSAAMVVDGQQFPGFSDEAGDWHFIFSPKEAKAWEYVIRSPVAELDGKSGGFTSYLPAAQRAMEGSSRHRNWWTDDPGPAVAEGVHHGAKTVSRWRVDYLQDFARRMERCGKGR